MSDPKHLDRWCALRDAVKASTGRALKGYAIVAIDGRGELYYGADWIECTNSEAARMADKLSGMASHIRQALKGRADPVLDAKQRPGDAEVTADLLGLVGISVSSEIVSVWTEEQVQAAEDWAAAAHLEASDNDVKAPPMPGFLRPYGAEATQ